MFFPYICDDVRFISIQTIQLYVTNFFIYFQVYIILLYTGQSIFRKNSLSQISSFFYYLPLSWTEEKTTIGLRYTRLFWSFWIVVLIKKKKMLMLNSNCYHLIFVRFFPYAYQYCLNHFINYLLYPQLLKLLQGFNSSPLIRKWVTWQECQECRNVYEQLCFRRSHIDIFESSNVISFNRQ